MSPFNSSSDVTSQAQIFVAIPTCNRETQLRLILQDLNQQSVRPNRIAIVDSSDKSEIMCDNTFDLVIKHFHVNIKSAAQQRNIALDYLQGESATNSIVFFLDDDVRIEGTYIEEILKVFDSDKDVVGISGITIQDPIRTVKRNSFTDWIGATGEPGKITRAGINIAVRNSSHCGLVSEWLIGCSAWRLNSIGNLRFESDFQGNSIYEDVIFSYRMKEKGKLLVLPTILIHHNLSQINRASVEKTMSDWVLNRRRLLSYDIEKKLSKWRMLLHDLVLIVFLFFKSLEGNRDAWSRFKGIAKGLLKLL
jgi:GT2 family glycosyltransferase